MNKRGQVNNFEQTQQSSPTNNHKLLWTIIITILIIIIGFLVYVYFSPVYLNNPNNSTNQSNLSGKNNPVLNQSKNESHILSADEQKACMDNCTKAISEPVICSERCGVVIQNNSINVTITNLTLTKEKTIDVTLNISGTKIMGRRPDVTVIDNKFYLMYDSAKAITQNKVSQQRCGDGVCDAGPENITSCPGDCGNNLVSSYDVSLIILDNNLNQISFTQNMKTNSADQTPTDIRTFSSNDNFGYGIETFNMPSAPTCNCNNHLNYWIYNTNNLQAPISGQENIATGCTRIMLETAHCTQEEINKNYATDDPAPFYYNSKNCFVIRKDIGARLKIMCFDDSGNTVVNNTIDLTNILPLGTDFTQNSIVILDNKPWVIGGAATNFPMLNGTSSIYAIPLSTNLDSTIGNAVEIIASNETYYYERVVAIKTYKNYILLTYLERPTPNRTGVVNYIAAFDYRNAFKQVANVVITNYSIADNHMPMEVLGDKAYVFHQTGDEDSNIVAEVFDIR